MKGVLKKNKRRGFSLVELLIAIVLIFVISVALTLSRFPSREELSQKNPKDALKIVIRSARKVANRDTQEKHVHFFDNATPLKLNDLLLGQGSNGNLQTSITDAEQQTSVLELLQAATNNAPKQWYDLISEYTTRAPLLLVTNADGKFVFDENKLCYALIQSLHSNANDPISSNANVFEKNTASTSSGTTSGKANEAGKNSGPHSFFTVYSNGLCDSVKFTANNYYDTAENSGVSQAQYDVLIDSFQGVVEPSAAAN
jgi:prepilin-type N-terminal cleavage/methylation domain-containing protein